MLFHIALKDLKVIFRDRKALAIMLAMPLMIVMILGFALGSMFNQELAIQRFSVGVVNHDEGMMSQVFINEVLRKNMKDIFSTFVVDEIQADQMLKDNTVPCVIIIPEDFSKNIDSKAATKVEIKTNDDTHLKDGIVRSVTEGFAQGITRSLIVSEIAEDVYRKYDLPVNKPFEGMSDKSAIMFDLQKKLGNEMLEFKAEEQEKERSLTAMEYYAAAMLVMFLLFGANMGTRLIVEERENRTLGRIMSARPGKVTLITGKFLGLMFICLAQATILMLFTRIFYGVVWGSSLPGLLLITLSSVFAAASFGMFIAAIAKTPKAADGFGQLFIQVFTVLGGGMWPVYLMPDAMKTIAKFTLNWWAFNGYHNIMLGMGAGKVLPACGILLLMGTIYLGAGVLRFRV